MTENSKRDAPISYRPPQGLRREFVRRVEASGLSVNAFLTRAVFANRRRPAERQALAQIMAEVAAIRDRLEAITGGDSADQHAAACDELAAIRAALLKMMERAP